MKRLGALIGKDLIIRLGNDGDGCGSIEVV